MDVTLIVMTEYTVTILSRMMISRLWVQSTVRKPP